MLTNKTRTNEIKQKLSKTQSAKEIYSDTIVKEYGYHEKKREEEKYRRNQLIQSLKDEGNSNKSKKLVQFVLKSFLESKINQKEQNIDELKREKITTELYKKSTEKQCLGFKRKSSRNMFEKQRSNKVIYNDPLFSNLERSKISAMIMNSSHNKINYNGFRQQNIDTKNRINKMAAIIFKKYV